MPSTSKAGSLDDLKENEKVPSSLAENESHQKLNNPPPKRKVIACKLLAALATMIILAVRNS
jgi:hypothetical protein